MYLHSLIIDKITQTTITLSFQLCPTSVTSPGVFDMGVLLRYSIDSSPLINAFAIATDLRINFFPYRN